MTVKQRLSRSNIYMFLIPLLIAAALLRVGAGSARGARQSGHADRLHRRG